MFNSFWLCFYHSQMMLLFSIYVSFNLPALVFSGICLQNVPKNQWTPLFALTVPVYLLHRGVNESTMLFTQQICSRGWGRISDSLLSLQPIHKLPYFSGILAAGLWIGQITGKTTAIVCPRIKNLMLRSCWYFASLARFRQHISSL